MRELKFRLLVAFLTFMLGIGAAFLWSAVRPASRSMTSPGKLSLPFAKVERTYQRGPAGLATTGSFITLNSSDGMSFTKWSVYCGSPEGAERELKKRIKKAIKIVSQELVFDKAGHQVGEKIVVLFSPGDPDNSASSLLWTENDELFQVESSSLQNILEYRKDFKR